MKQINPSFFSKVYWWVKEHPGYLVGFVFLLTSFLLLLLPPWQVSAIGVMASVITLYYSSKQIPATEIKATDSFKQAIDQLENEKLEIRLSAINTLERISNESDGFYWLVLEYITDYVRQNSSIVSKKQGPISKDIQEILDIIRRRKHYFREGESKCLNLQGTWLRKANIESVNLSGANLHEVDLQDANLKGADLRYAKFDGSNLRGANLKGADIGDTSFSGSNLIEIDLSLSKSYCAEFKGAKLERANFKWAQIRQADFEKANLQETNLERVDLFLANLTDANLKRANLEGAYLKEANFRGANLEGANLRGANIKEAKNLSLDQLSKVKTLYNAELDDMFRIPLEKDYPNLFEEPKDK